MTRDMSLGWMTTHGDVVTVFPKRTPRGLRWRWHVQSAGNNEIVEHGESYSRRVDAIEAATRHHPLMYP